MERLNVRRVRAACAPVIAALVAFTCARAHADAGWFEAGDLSLRVDLQVLNDAEIIRLPINHWPLPRAAVAHALSNAKLHYATSAAVSTALSRVRARLEEPGGATFEAAAVAGEPSLLRDFDSIGRESAEIGVRADYGWEKTALTLRVSGAADPADGKELRLDGSHATVQWGNWLVSAHTLDRWWGPGHEGSLILSSNARPMPTVMVERATAIPFESSWLHWLGPWRLSFGISQMENEREDIDRPLFMAWRVAVMPFKDIELGFSRTAQFCGVQLQCGLDSFLDLLVGNDNVGIDVTPEAEPGNQMAGFDIRWTSPIGSWPYAVYSQMIGEDESGYLPAKYISQFGIEWWKPLAEGGLIQGFAEYSTTTCSAHSNSGPYYNCAYNQGRFNVEGYRYYGRVIGYSSDRDAENYSVGATCAQVDGTLWSATARRSRLNRNDFTDVENTVSSVPADYFALELGWKGELLGQSVSVDLGVESFEPVGGDRDVEPFGFVGWRHEFGP